MWGRVVVKFGNIGKLLVKKENYLIPFRLVEVSYNSVRYLSNTKNFRSLEIGPINVK